MNYKNSLILLGAFTFCLSLNAAIAPKKEIGLKNYKEIQTPAEYKAALNAAKPQIVKFYTKSCGACHSMEPIYNEAARKENLHADFSAINIEDEAFKELNLIDKHSLKSVPTTVFLKYGKEIKRDVGSMTKDDFDRQIKSFVKG